MFTTETRKKTDILYILELVCLLLKYKNRCVAHIKTSMFPTEIRKKTGMLYILKLVCLLLKYKKIGYVVNIETSMFSTEKNGNVVHSESQN